MLYTSREGSSAIVQSLSKQPDISVPLLEELDKHWLDKFYPESNVVDELDKVYTTSDLDFEHDYGRRNFIARKDAPTEAASTGFKWRYHGPFTEVVEVLQRHEVMVFVLMRRDLLELTSSYYLTKVGKAKGTQSEIGHSQFQVAHMTEKEADAFRKDFDKLTVPMRPVLFYSIMAWRIWKAFGNQFYAWRASRAGLRTATIYYEDFCEDPDRFFRDFSDQIGVRYLPVDGPGASKPLKKTSDRPPRDKIRNMWIVDYNPLTYVLRAVYGGLCR